MCNNTDSGDNIFVIKELQMGKNEWKNFAIINNNFSNSINGKNK